MSSKKKRVWTKQDINAYFDESRELESARRSPHRDAEIPDESEDHMRSIVGKA